MTCTETQELIPGYLDGELDLIHSLAMEEHLRTCVNCTRAYHRQQALGTALRTSNLYYAPPPALQQRIQSAIQQAQHAPPTPRTLPWRGLGFVTALAAVALLVAVWLWGSLLPGVSDPLPQEVVASHVRSLMADHLADVASSDQHTVKPWFDGKLDYAPPVIDLAAQGYPLIGGRLDYIADRPVAALVYQRGKHYINLFLWPTAQGGAGGVQSTTRQGYNLRHWTEAGMTLWAVSDLNSAELDEFVRLFQQAPAPAAPAITP